MELFSHQPGDDAEQEEWEGVKASILTSLRRGGAIEYRNLLRALLARTPEARSPLAYCSEVITALLLSLRVIKYKFCEHDPINTAMSAPVTKVGMGALAGFTLGQLLAHEMGQRFAANFQNYIGKYEAALGELSHENLSALHEFTRQVVGTFTTEQGQF
jgi:hypothetical protein